MIHEVFFIIKEYAFCIFLFYRFSLLGSYDKLFQREGERERERDLYFIAIGRKILMKFDANDVASCRSMTATQK